MRYSARDVAVFRAHQLGIPVVLGSATPSLESWANARSGRYGLLALRQRANPEAVLPAVHLLDTRKMILQDGISEPLIAAIGARLTRGEQSLVFLNRRGYAPVLACAACGWVSRCQRCAANLVLHMADRRLRCHHCGFEARVPKACPTCGNQDIHPFGRGTQRLEIWLQERFPQARILRVDRDSVKSRKQWEAMLERIHGGEADILVGTQMLAKGHDFPKLTLVGVLGADAALFAADWRAPERLFAQLMQVAGRAGRGDRPGQVVLQTYNPEHFSIRAARDQDVWNYLDGVAEQSTERAREGENEHLNMIVPIDLLKPILDDLRKFGRAERPAAVFLGAFLLLQIQPIAGKTLLPRFGGSAAVWTTCLVFFQVALVAGYLYAHGLVRYLRPAAQRLVHIGVLAAGAAAPSFTTSKW